MRYFLLFWAIGWAFFPAFSQAITSDVYSYTQLPVINYTGYEERTLLEGATRDFSHLLVQAMTLQANQPGQPTQQLEEEAVLIIKAGELTLTLGGKRKTLGPGSVVVIMPGDDYLIENKAAQSLTYYFIRYTSNEVPDLDIFQLMGHSYWIDWQQVAFTDDKHGRDRRMVPCFSVMSSRFALQVTTLNPGSERYPPHTHRAAELSLILDHPVQVEIDGKMKRAQVGDLIFVESDISHSIQNSSQEGSTFFSLQF
ncbi:hypothetical protein GCM10028808_65270 [Spirosoma migulaei]